MADYKQTPTEPLENLVGPSIVFNSNVEYIGPGMHCITLKYSGNGRGQLNLGYDDVTAVFIDGESRWQNKDYSTATPCEGNNIELILSPGTQFRSKKHQSLRFQRPGDKTQKDFLKIITDEVDAVYQNQRMVWPNQPTE